MKIHYENPHFNDDEDDLYWKHTPNIRGWIKWFLIALAAGAVIGMIWVGINK